MLSIFVRWKNLLPFGLFRVRVKLWLTKYGLTIPRKLPAVLPYNYGHFRAGRQFGASLYLVSIWHAHLRLCSMLSSGVPSCFRTTIRKSSCGDNFIRNFGKNISKKSPRHSHPSRWARLKVEHCFYGTSAAFPPLSHVELRPTPILSWTHNGGFRKISVCFQELQLSFGKKESDYPHIIMQPACHFSA